MWRFRIVLFLIILKFLPFSYITQDWKSTLHYCSLTSKLPSLFKVRRCGTCILTQFVSSFSILGVLARLLDSLLNFNFWKFCTWIVEPTFECVLSSNNFEAFQLGHWFTFLYINFGNDFPVFVSRGNKGSVAQSLVLEHTNVWNVLNEPVHSRGLHPECLA